MRRPEDGYGWGLTRAGGGGSTWGSTRGGGRGATCAATQAAFVLLSWPMCVATRLDPPLRNTLPAHSLHQNVQQPPGSMDGRSGTLAAHHTGCANACRNWRLDGQFGSARAKFDKHRWNRQSALQKVRNCNRRRRLMGSGLIGGPEKRDGAWSTGASTPDLIDGGRGNSFLRCRTS